MVIVLKNTKYILVLVVLIQNVKAAHSFECGEVLKWSDSLESITWIQYWTKLKCENRFWKLITIRISWLNGIFNSYFKLNLNFNSKICKFYPSWFSFNILRTKSYFKKGVQSRSSDCKALQFDILPVFIASKLNSSSFAEVLGLLLGERHLYDL